MAASKYFKNLTRGPIRKSSSHEAGHAVSPATSDRTDRLDKLFAEISEMNESVATDISTRDERVHHYLYVYLFNHPNYLYQYLYSEWAGPNPEVGVDVGGA